MTGNAPASTLKALIGSNVNCIKALLAFVVAADHNEFFWKLFPTLFEPITFPVFGYFLLIFTFGRKIWSKEFIADRCARYLVPYWWALTAASVAYYFMYQRHTNPAESVAAWALAAVIGNAPFVKPASGFLMLWFLPSLFGLTCLIALYNTIQTRWGQSLAVGLAVLAHLLLPLLPRLTMLWIPFGLAIMANVFILGLIWQRLLSVRLPRYWGLVVAAIFVASYGRLVSVPVHLEMATFELAGINAPGTMILQDLAGMSGVLTIVWLASLTPKFQWLEALGKNSIWIYLFHPVAYVVLGRVWIARPDDPMGPLGYWVHGCLTEFGAIGLAYLAAILMSRSTFISVWIIPRSWEQWPPSRLLANARVL
ncbi:acyltransferase family protein [Propionivibrio sp.]|uniref:acyltransferase family protein n=1 Tax=Propionivibrio sp. TaxID=2212460 RepID=UPI0039E63183